MFRSLLTMLLLLTVLQLQVLGQDVPNTTALRFARLLGEEDLTQKLQHEIREAMESKDPEVRGEAVKLVGRFGTAAGPLVDDLFKRFSDRGLAANFQEINVLAARSLVLTKAKVVPRLLQFLESDDPEIRRAAALALHDYGQKVAPHVAELITQLKHAPQPRLDLIHILAGIGPPAQEAVPFLLDQLKSEDFHSQYFACQALGAIGDPTALPGLIDRCSNGVASVRRHALRAVGQLGSESDEAYAAVLKGLDDPLAEVRRSAAIALGNLGEHGKGAAPKIRKMMEPPYQTGRCELAVALWRTTGELELAREVLVQEVSSPHLPWDAVWGFRQLGPAASEAVPALTELLASPEQTVFAAQALGAIGPKAESALPELEQLKASEEPLIRHAAAAAVSAIKSPAP